MKHPVKSKPDFYKRWINGEFGNRLRVWNSIDEILESGYSGNIGIRYKLPSSPFCKYDVPISDLTSEMNKFVKMGADPRLFTLGEMAPDQHILFQGEVQISINHLDLHYSLIKKQMRPALKEAGQHASGLKSRLLIQHYMDPQSYNDVETLLNEYQDHVIEFSCYSICLGNCPGRNTLIWECRQY